MNPSRPNIEAFSAEEIEETEFPDLPEDERLELIASLDRAEAGIARGEYIEIDPATYLDELKKKLFPKPLL